MNSRTLHRSIWAGICLITACLVAVGSWIWWVKSERKRTVVLLRSTVIEGYVADESTLEEALEKLVYAIKTAEPQLDGFAINWEPMTNHYRGLSERDRLEFGGDPRSRIVSFDTRGSNRQFKAMEICGALCITADLNFAVNPDEINVGIGWLNGRDFVESQWDRICRFVERGPGEPSYIPMP